MLFNLQNLFQTEDNEVWVAGLEDHPGRGWGGGGEKGRT